MIHDHGLAHVDDFLQSAILPGVEADVFLVEPFRIDAQVGTAADCVAQCEITTGRDGPVVYITYSRRHSGMSKIIAGVDGVRTAPVVNVGRLDELIPRPGPGIVAKIDVEEAEIDVLSVLRQTHFDARVREIIIEISFDNLGQAGREELLAMLAQDGFEERSRAGPPDHYDAVYRR